MVQLITSNPFQNLKMTEFVKTSITEEILLPVQEIIQSEPLGLVDENPFTTEISSHVLNNHFVKNKMQDRVFTFKGLLDYNGEEMDALYTFDGHGTSKVIHTIEKMPLEEIAKDKYPLAEILRLLDERGLELNKNRTHFMKGLKGSGSTYVLTRVYKNRLVVNYCGDSEVVVFKNGIKVLETMPHNVYNTAEMDRTTKVCTKNCIEDGNDLSLISKDSLTMVKSNRIVLNDPVTMRYQTTLGPTMALGHNRVTGYDFVDGVQGAVPDYIVEFEDTDEIILVQGSDGLWDMIIKDDPDDTNDLLTLNAIELVEKYRERWFQTWNYIADTKKPEVVIKTPLKLADPDDIAAVVYRRVRK